jgi:hypothetical protein
MMRQVFVYDPKTGRSEHRYVEAGPGAAKRNHGAGPVHGQMVGGGAVTRPGAFVAPKVNQTTRTV